VSKRILVIAYHFPPILVSSGLHRTAKFTQYLPDYDWYPDVLTVNTRAYIRTSNDKPVLAPKCTLTRAFALDTSRHLSIKGKYSKFMSLPDRWISWWLGAIPAGLDLIKRNKPKVIWSTYPIATAHLIAYTLHRLTGIPWVADFRDPMTDVPYPEDRHTKAVYRWIEKKTIKHCSHAIFTTPGTLKLYADRYPHIPSDHWHVIANGYDEEAFDAIDVGQKPAEKPASDNTICLVHSGILYKVERNPEPFFEAIVALKKSGDISKDTLKIILRASGNEDNYQQRLNQLKIDDIVILAAALPYQEALSEMLTADGLLLFQAATCNRQIPAKAYEYLRAHRPIFALTDAQGNTAALLKDAGIDTQVDIESKEQIAAGLMRFIQLVKNKTAPLAPESVIQTHSRKHRTIELVKILDSIE